VVGFVLPFDRLLDMMRTVPSASANLTVATTVARWEGGLDEAVLRGPNDVPEPRVATAVEA
jgi:Na+/H+-dicarboxylate symporter